MSFESCFDALFLALLELTWVLCVTPSEMSFVYFGGAAHLTASSGGILKISCTSRLSVSTKLMNCEANNTKMAAS